MKHDLIIARYGELALKSDGVRKRFENRLANNIRASIDAEVKVRQARIYISPKDFNDAIEKLERIFGIVSYSPAVTTKSTFEDIERDVSKYAEKLHEEGLLDEREDIRDFEVYANEISVEELIAEKEESIKKQLLKRYIERRYDYDNLTIRQYSQLCRQFDFKNKEIYLDMLEEEMRISRIKNLLRRKISPADISLKDYNQAVRELYAAKNNGEMETILEKYNVK